jgi:hypothetical protein
MCTIRRGTLRGDDIADRIGRAAILLKPLASCHPCRVTSVWVPIASGAAVAAITALLTFLATRWKIGKDFEIEITRALRNDRIDVYRKLWTISEPLAYHGKERFITYAEAEKLGIALRRWYYREGGLFLSENSRDRYFDLQKALARVYNGIRAQSESWKALTPKEFFAVQARSSDLRTALAYDLGTRRRGLEKATEGGKAAGLVRRVLRRTRTRGVRTLSRNGPSSGSSRSHAH